MTMIVVDRNLSTEDTFTTKQILTSCVCTFVCARARVCVYAWCVRA
jgi:hypothetical protein